jgi:CDP-diacylglycerol--glycerol-3-phosphate 3-phosphatidyltransferase
MRPMMGLDRARKTLAYYLTMPVVHLLVMTPVTPNQMSVTGFLLAVATGVLIAFGHLFAAGFVMLVSGYFDIIDGALARAKGKATRFGGVLDDTFDRVSESIILLGILILFLFGAEQPFFSLIGREWAVFLVGVALLSFPLVSHIRAKAEAMGIECTVGVLTRTERVILLALGLWINQLVIILVIIVLLSWVSAGQRLFHTWRNTKIQA